MAKATTGGADKKKSGGTASSSSGLMAVQELEQILTLMGKHQVAELEWENAGVRLHLRTQGAIGAAQHGTGAVSASPFPAFAHHAPIYAPAPAAPAPAPAPKPAEAPAAAKPAAAANPNLKTISSPFVGTFYRSPSPEAEAYAREGKSVKRGDVLCIIEAMKLMNEIESEFNGKIVSILVENGQPVEFGEPLFTIETT